MVSNFVAELRFTKVLFDWDPPQDPNGIIVAYELTYRVNSDSPMTWNVSTTAFTLPVAPNTKVYDISIRAYTRMGPGDVAKAEDLLIPAATMSIRELSSDLPNKIQSQHCKKN